MSKSTRNPTWDRDELILALDLYFRRPPQRISQSDEEVIRLSELLNQLPIHKERPDESRFRNPNGVYMKLCNFLRFDPNYKGKGLKGGGKIEEQIWTEFANDRQRLRDTAAAIAAGVSTGVGATHNESEEDEEYFPEGRVLYRWHRNRERNQELVRKVKQKAIDAGELCCVVCKFDFEREYGEVGRGFIECHHTVPVSDYKSDQKTRVTDLALVCSNCHRMLHRRRPWLKLDELIAIRKTTPKTNSR